MIKNKEISIGIIIFGLLYIVSGVSAFAAILITLFAPINRQVMNLNIYAPLLGTFAIIIGSSLLKNKEWSRQAVIVLACVAIFAGVFGFFCYNISALKIISVFALSVIQLYFFTRPRTKAQFKLNRG